MLLLSIFSVILEECCPISTVGALHWWKWGGCGSERDQKVVGLIPDPMACTLGDPLVRRWTRCCIFAEWKCVNGFLSRWAGGRMWGENGQTCHVTLKRSRWQHMCNIYRWNPAFCHLRSAENDCRCGKIKGRKILCCQDTSAHHILLTLIRFNTLADRR